MNGTEEIGHCGAYKQALEHIRAHGHAAFLNAAEHWTNACGKYSEQDA